MSLKTSFPAYIRSIAGKNIRCYAAASQAAESQLSPRQDVQYTSSNGVTVATLETNKPVAKLSVFYRAGSRYEDAENLGIVHALRFACGLGTKGASHLGITRHTQQAGGNLYCTTGREYVSYTLEATRDKIEKLQQIFQDVTSRQAFKRWELKDDEARFRHDLDTVSIEVRVLEMLHKAAFRRGLGNSLYSPRHMVGHHSQDMLLDYVQKNFVEASVVGLGLSQDTVGHFAQSLGVVKNDNPTPASKFHGGGDIRKEIGGNVAYVALAIEGGRLSNQKEALTAAVAQRALGSGPRTGRGVNAGGKLSFVNTETSSATGLSASYSDSGILGAFVIGTPENISNATKKAAGILREANYTEDEVARGRNQLKADLTLSWFESDCCLLESIGLESLLTGSVTSLKDYEPIIDSITASDVNNLVKKSGGKLSLAAMGHVANVPYLDELK